MILNIINTKYFPTILKLNTKLLVTGLIYLTVYILIITLSEFYHFQQTEVTDLNKRLHHLIVIRTFFSMGHEGLFDWN